MTAVPGSQEEEEAKRISREEQQLSEDRNTSSLSPVKKGTMRQRFDERVAEQQTNENS